LTKEYNIDEVLELLDIKNKKTAFISELSGRPHHYN
jgi:hypothetical protein